MLLFSLNACGAPGTDADDYLWNKSFPVDRALRSFYESLDGENLLGVALSPLIEIDGDLCQYTVGALMCVDPQATGIAPYFLKPLGTYLNIAEAPADSKPQETAYIVDGFVIHPQILPLYEQFGGKLFAGSPITNAFYNPTSNRYEQYFENLAFYYDEDNPGSKTGLVRIGQEICRDQCPPDLTAIPPASLGRENPLSDMLVAVDFLGGEALFGPRLTGLSIATDGNLEIVYENASFYAPPDNPRWIQMRELPAHLGIPVLAPGPRKFGVESKMDFYATDGELGYHIPLVFEQFLNQHGGFPLSGLPIGDPFQYEGMELPRQCFRHICLEYDRQATDGKVSLLELGRQYLATQPGLKPFTPRGGLGAAMLELEQTEVYLAFDVSERHPQVRRSQAQVIEIYVFDRDTGQPVGNVSASLTVIHPDGTVHQYNMPATNAAGKSSVAVDPIGQAQDSDLVTYQVCLDATPQMCLSEAYLIWAD